MPRRGDGLCPQCETREKMPSGGYCLRCHAARMREYRKTHKPSEEQRRKGIARSYLNVYLRRGKVVKLPCQVCGRTEHVEGHHHDGYDKPLVVTWLCRPHHRQVHAA